MVKRLFWKRRRGDRIEAMKTRRTIALLCGLVPMLAGSASFFAWLALGDPAFAGFGAMVIAGGIVLFVVGAIILGQASLVAARDETVMKPSMVLPWFFLIANFPLCVLYIIVFVSLLNTSVIVLKNASRSEIGDFSIDVAGGNSHGQPAVAAGASHTACIAFESRQHSIGPTVHYRFKLDGKAHSGELFEYLLPGFGSRADILVDAGQNVSVVQSDNVGSLLACLF